MFGSRKSLHNRYVTAVRQVFRRVGNGPLGTLVKLGVVGVIVAYDELPARKFPTASLVRKARP